MDNSTTPDISERDYWDGELYRNACSFVPELGENLIEWLNPQSGESILDLGCGTGELTAKLSSYGCNVTGLDSSKQMLKEAKNQHPNLKFVHADINSFSSDEKFNAIFSNASLHWIKTPDRAIKSSYELLSSGGRFVAEMGVEGNVSKIRNVLHDELDNAGHDPEQLDPWYFPEPESYINKLKSQGFSIRRMDVFDRPTKLFGPEGLKVWLLMFAEQFLDPLSENTREKILSKIVSRLSEELYEDGNWIIDYRRLRFAAHR